MNRIFRCGGASALRTVSASARRSGLAWAQIGHARGLTPVHVNRTLKALKELGVVEVEGRSFRIPDWSRLAAIAEFDPGYLQIVALADEAA